MPFRRQVVLGVVAIALLALATTGFVYHGMLAGRDALDHIVETANPAAAAAYEMEINTVETGLKVLKFLQLGEPQLRAGVLKDMGEFDAHLETYLRLAQGGRTTAFAGQAGELFAQFRALALRLMDGPAAQEQLLVPIMDALKRLDVVVDKELRQAIDATPRRAADPASLAAQLEVEVAEVGAALGFFLRQATPEHLASLRRHAGEFDTALHALQRIGLGARAGSLVDQVGEAWAAQQAPMQRLVQLRQEADQDLGRFLAVRVRLDDLLDEGIQAHAVASVDAANRSARQAQNDALVRLAVSLVLIGVVSILIYHRLRRLARAVVARFMQAAEAFGRGDFDHRMPRMSDPDIDRVGDAYHAMARRLQETMVSSQRLRDSEGKLRSILTQMEEGYYEIDLEGRLKFFNPALARILGCAEVELPGVDPRELVSESTARRVILAVGRVLESGQSVRDLDVEITTRSGAPRTLALSVQRVLDDGGQAIALRGLLYDVSERKRLEASIERLVTHDSMTGLPNQLLLEDRTGQALSAAARDGDSCALLLIRIEHLKELNNTLGPGCGNLLIAKAAQRLQEGLAPADTLARAGGEEFALLLTHAGRVQAESAAAHALKAFERPFDIDGTSIHAEVSIGLALSPLHASAAPDLLRCAHVAAASAIPGSHAVYQAGDKEIGIERLSLYHDLRNALTRGDELALQYQPKLRLRDRMPCGVEALARWRHPQRGWIPPSDFIPLLEKRGLIGPFTLWALECAARQSVQWHRIGLNVPIAVNVSPVALRDPSFPAQMLEVIDRFGAVGDWLELELTESTLMEEPELMLQRLAPLLRRGVRLSIDDFGTGYSSLSMLRRFRAGELKIDGSFIHDMLSHADNAMIVQSIIQLAHGLGMTVVAEGTESDEVIDRLAAMGCDAAQGFAIGKPMPVEQATGWLLDATESAFASAFASI